MLAEKVAAPVGVCHWALLPEFAQILICEDLQKDERWGATFYALTSLHCL